MRRMARSVFLAVFITVFLFSTGLVRADGEVCTDSPYAKAALKRAKEAESGGRTLRALVLYQKIWFCEDKGATAQLEAGIRRILVALGRAQEKKGIIDGSSDYIRRVQDAQCSRLDRSRMDSQGNYKDYDELKGPDNDCFGPMRAELNESAGAYWLYRAAQNSAEAEGVLVRSAKAKPKDFKTVRFAFDNIESAGNLDEGYHPGAASVRELRRIAGQNVDELLSAEDKSFVDKTVHFSTNDPMLGMAPVGRSLKLLGQAKEWASLLDKETTDKVLSRAGKRGAEVMAVERQSPSHASLADALELYTFAEDRAGAREVKAQAERRGKLAASKGDKRDAALYFAVSGNKKRAKDMGVQEEDTSGRQRPDKDVMKSEKEQKKFKKGADDLEKELGL